MGGGQSQEEEERGEEPENQTESDQSNSSAAEDTPGELPQCRMGTRTVDNMCFMISCTNWY